VHDREAEPGVVAQVLRVVERAAGADVGAAVLAQQALLLGTAERRAVGVRRAEVGVPRVQVGVEVHEGHRPLHLRDRAERWERDRVVAAQHHEAGALGADQVEARLDLPHCSDDVEGVARDVAPVHDLLGRERRDAELRVVRP